MLTRALLFGALAAVPALAVIAMPGPQPTVAAQCTAAFGSLNDGRCLDRPGPAQQSGTPSFNIGGGPGQGISSSPLFPGQTINIPLGPSN